MTKKISKKNLFCLFPPKAGKPKSQKFNTIQLATTYPPVPDSTSDWQAHYDFLEMGPWGSGLFGAPMDKEVEEMALRAIELAFEDGNKEKIAKSYRHLFHLYCEFNHPDSLTVGFETMAAAVKAYGPSTAEVGEELAMIACVHDSNNNHELAMKARDESIKIFEKSSTTERLFEALEMAISSASDIGRGDKVEEYARHGIRIVRERFIKGSEEYKDNLDYFRQMLDTAHDPPVPIEEQRRQLFAMFPNLQKGLEKIKRQQMRL